MSINTIIIFDSCGEDNIKFYAIGVDYSHLDKVYINSSEDESKCDELNKLTSELLPFEEFPVSLVTNKTKVIVCGFIP